MASTFGLLNSAYSGLAAARAALEVTGQNVANVNTPGYTRQRVDLASLPGVDKSSLFTTGLNIGTGVQITGISRISDSLIDARVRDTASSSGYWTAASTALSVVENGLGEPGDTGLSASLTQFSNAWQTMANTAGNSTTGPAAASALLGSAQALADRIASGYSTASKAWSTARSSAEASVDQVNRTGVQIAALNDQILRIAATGGNANELIDQRGAAINALSAATGATTRENANGTVDVLIGGSTFVSGTSARTLQLTGAAAAPFTATGLRFSDGAAVQADGGSLAAQLSTLAPEGVYSQAANAYSAVATQLATDVNAVHRQGAIADGTTGHDFFALDASKPAAIGLSVVPTSQSGIAAGKPGAGSGDGSIADAISQLGSKAGGVDRGWAAYVAGVGAQTKAATTQADVAATASSAAQSAQTSQSGVDLDEETANLVVFQHAYQGAARVLTAIDEMLDTLINRTGLVGR